MSSDPVLQAISRLEDKLDKATDRLESKVDSITGTLAQLNARADENDTTRERFFREDWGPFKVRVGELVSRVATLEQEAAVSRIVAEQTQKKTLLGGTAAGAAVAGLIEWFFRP